MLDFAHGLVQGAVDRDPDGDHSPALETLVRVGFVEHSGARLSLTPQGRAALEAGVPSRTERWALRVFMICVAVVAVGSIVERLF